MTIRRLLPLVLLFVLVATISVARLRPAPGGAAMTASAERFASTLSDAQRSQTLLAYEVPERTDWHYIPKPSRKGLQVKEMNAAQRKAAFDLLASALSAIGDGKATKIMQLEAILRELEKGRVNGQIRDPERYYFTLFGKPSAERALGTERRRASLVAEFRRRRRRGDLVHAHVLRFEPGAAAGRLRSRLSQGAARAGRRRAIGLRPAGRAQRCRSERRRSWPTRRRATCATPAKPVRPSQPAGRTDGQRHDAPSRWPSSRS